MSYSCTDLADATLEAADALAKVIGHAPVPDDDEFNDKPSKQADYIVDVMDAAEAQINALRAAARVAVAALDALANECTPANPGLARVFNRVIEETGVTAKLSAALARPVGGGLSARPDTSWIAGVSRDDMRAIYGTPGED